MRVVLPDSLRRSALNVSAVAPPRSWLPLDRWFRNGHAHTHTHSQPTRVSLPAKSLGLSPPRSRSEALEGASRLQERAAQVWPVAREEIDIRPWDLCDDAVITLPIWARPLSVWSTASSRSAFLRGDGLSSAVSPAKLLINILAQRSPGGGKAGPLT